MDLSDNSLQVVISDALSEKDRVKFTVLSKVRNSCIIQITLFQLFFL